MSAVGFGSELTFIYCPVCNKLASADQRHVSCTCLMSLRHLRLHCVSVGSRCRDPSPLWQPKHLRGVPLRLRAAPHLHSAHLGCWRQLDQLHQLVDVWRYAQTGTPSCSSDPRRVHSVFGNHAEVRKAVFWCQCSTMHVNLAACSQLPASSSLPRVPCTRIALCCTLPAARSPSVAPTALQPRCLK